MRILIFGTLPAMLFKFHGALIEALVAAGCEVHLAAGGLTRDLEYAPRLARLGARLHDVRLDRNGTNPLADLATLSQIARVIRAVRPDAMLSYTVKPVAYGTLAAWALRVPRKVALVVGLGYAFTDEAGSSPKRRAVRLVMSALYRLAFRAADLVVFQNRDDEREVRALGLLTKRDASAVVDGCGVDLAAFPAQPLPSRPVFLFVGRLLVDKGVREFVTAARTVRARFAAARFVLLGGLDTNPSGISADEVDGWVREGVVEWLGYHEDVAPALREASVFVLPSYREGLPQSAVEALSSAKPIVTTDVPGCRETVVHGENGLIVAARDAVALSTALAELAGAPELRERMARASRDLAERRFDARLVNRQLFVVLGLEAE
ncbi:glycosyltransferase family 4 protein [Novosphingobium sp. Gsoil 351]|uniref:glycosyltransferase family 4 protein n=1 Tax=Novosphingobium sp. Gsoil 351 TaxID=2675225 RepID=UPI0012B4E3EB|nr:glycosyltransferase family 4 protein [Novosphingobium sp. Gsoil 351]QGN54949.1 glycosyltransferase [Novosphingobium sp. Gsoil 351]